MFGKRGFGILEPQIDLVAGIEERGTDRDVLAKHRFDGEGIEAALQFLAAVEDDAALGRSAGLVVAHQSAAAVARDVEPINIAGDAEAGAGDFDGSRGVPGQAASDLGSAPPNGTSP